MLAALLQHVALVCILALGAAVACRVLRLGPAGRHALWLVVLIKLAMPPVLTVRTPFAWTDVPGIGQLWVTLRSDPSHSRSDTLTPLVASAADAREASAAQPANEESARPATTPAMAAAPSTSASETRLFPLQSTAVALWAIGAIVFLAVQLARIRGVRRWLRRSSEADPALTARVALRARQLRIPVVPIRVVPDLPSPLVWSIWRPILLWPATLPRECSAACVDGLIVHELAHVKRRDHRVSWLELAAGVVWWWNPIYWYVRTQVREHAELACDALVVHTLPQGRRAYAEALVAVCDLTSPRAVPVPAVGVTAGSRRVLERRLVMIMRGNVSSRLSRTGFAVVVALGAATLPAWAQRATPRTPPAAPPAVSEVPVEVAPEGRRPQVVTPRAVAPRAGAVVFVPAAQALPSDAQRLIDRFERDQTQTLRDANAKITQQREDLVRQLQTLEETYAGAGRADDAAAVRRQIRTLGAARAPLAAPAVTPPTRGDRTSSSVDFSRPVVVEHDASDLTTYRHRVGETVAVTVTGSRSGPVWGTDIYTDDSSLGTAAVHAGLLQPGETASVLVRILPGQTSYDGSRQHGVVSHAYGDWHGSYGIVAVSDVRREHRTVPQPPSPATSAISPSPTTAPVATNSDVLSNLGDFRAHVFESFTANVVGSTSGMIWGSDIYTDDSPVAVAAVHAGLVRPGERATLKITLLPGLSRYAAVERNGVTSSEYGKWEGSYRLERVK
jgi:beta-lactamase regulating signal transducer with metallopeptidase domain